MQCERASGHDVALLPRYTHSASTGNQPTDRQYTAYQTSRRNGLLTIRVATRAVQQAMGYAVASITPFDFDSTAVRRPFKCLSKVH